MALIFENPANGYREEVSELCPLWMLMFGAFYLLVKGLWPAFFLWVGVAVLLVLAGGPPMFLFAVFLLSVTYPFVIKHLLMTKYLQRGWKQIQ